MHIAIALCFKCDGFGPCDGSAKAANWTALIDDFHSRVRFFLASVSDESIADNLRLGRRIASFRRCSSTWSSFWTAVARRASAPASSTNGKLSCCCFSSCFSIFIGSVRSDFLLSTWKIRCVRSLWLSCNVVPILLVSFSRRPWVSTWIVNDDPIEAASSDDTSKGYDRFVFECLQMRMNLY